MTQRWNPQVHASKPRGAGCPDVLEVDLPEQDVGVRTTDWLDGPPTASRHRSRASDDVDVVDLTTTRAARLLDATIAHVHAAREAAAGSAACHDLDRALSDIERARDVLIEVGDTAAAPRSG